MRAELQGLQASGQHDLTELAQLQKQLAAATQALDELHQ